jgi:hypothetical protein
MKLTRLQQAKDQQEAMLKQKLAAIDFYAALEQHPSPNVKAKGKTLTLVKSRSKPVFCRGKCSWRSEFEERISKDDEIVLLALGDVKMRF